MLEAIAELRRAFDDLLECGAGKRVEFRLRVRDHGCRASAPIHEPQFAKELAGPDGVHHLLGAVLALDRLKHSLRAR